MFDKKSIVAKPQCFSGAHDAAMCVIWAEQFLANNTTLAEEIEEVRGTISNERVWQKGSEDESIMIHEQNIQNLMSYLSWLESFE